MRKLEEQTIHSRTLFEGRVIRVELDEVRLPNGETSTRELVRHPGAVSVLAVTEEGKIVLVRQYRKPLEREILELPAGKLEPGEEPADCARRELEEETGYRATELTHLVSFYTSPGFADELLHLYEAQGVSEGTFQPDEDEFVERVELTLEEAFERVKSGEICDAKTVTALYILQGREQRAR
ncbi:ADP-ribose pyrophosphatase [Kroppenstedtia sanguinis]